ncbi:PPE domain-containing protein [Mycolicibacterium porcinum]
MGNFKVVAEALTAAAEQMSEPRYDGPDKQHPTDPYGLDVPDAALPETKEAINQLKNSTGILMTALKAGDAETKRLILSLKSAAAAYTEMDERSAAALGTQGTDPSKKPAIEPVTPKPIENIDVPKIDYGGYPSSPDDQWAKWTTAARAINEHGDPEAMQRVEAFQTSWGQYQTDLKNWVEANIPLEVGNWEGDAAVSCKNALLSLRSWWNDMANECKNLSIEAGKLLSAHKQLASVHPNMHDVEVDGNGWLNPIDWSNFQYQSEYDRNNYENNINLTQIRPGGPPTISGLPNIKSNDVGNRPGTQTPQIPGTSPGTTGDTGSTGSTPEMPEMPEMPSMDTPSVSPASADPSSGQESGGSPSAGGSPSGGSPSGSGGSPSGGAPSTGGLPKGTGGMPEVPGLGEPSLKPASAGGGGGGMGGGGGGMPAGPLGPAVGADSVAASPSGARGAGGGVPGAPGGAGAGGMGGGMGGMGGGHGQGQGKEKRRNPNLSEDEDLYVEDRAYTEAVIGRRARKDAKDGK